MARWIEDDLDNALQDYVDRRITAEELVRQANLAGYIRRPKLRLPKPSRVPSLVSPAKMVLPKAVAVAPPTAAPIVKPPHADNMNRILDYHAADPKRYSLNEQSKEFLELRRHEFSLSSGQIKWYKELLDTHLKQVSAYKNSA